MTKQRQHIAEVLLADRYEGELLYIRIFGENECHMTFGTETGCTEIVIYSHNDDGDAEIAVNHVSYEDSTP